MKPKHLSLLLFLLCFCSGCGSGGHSVDQDRNPVYQDQPPAPPENRPYPQQKVN